MNYKETKKPRNHCCRGLWFLIHLKNHLKNLDGMSRKYPTWIKEQIEKIATYLITKSDVDVMSIIKQAFDDLDYGRFEAKDMQFTEQLDRNPNQYPNDKDIRVKVLGLELGA